MKLILADKSAADPENLSPTAERLINVYPKPAPEGSQGMLILGSVPGTRDLATVPGPFLRAMKAVEGVLYAISAGALYRVGGGGTVSRLAAVTDDPDTAMSGHRSAVAISSGGNYSLWQSGALTQPGAGRLTNVGSVAFLDQFTILSERDGREVEWTAVGQPQIRNGLYFGTAEGRDDQNVRIVESGGYFLVFKQTSTEVWGSTGRGGASAFKRVQGAVIETGLLDFNLVTETPGGLFLVGHDGVAYISNGGALSAVSTPAVNQAIKETKPSHCFYYEDRGHRFCVVRFSDRPAWVFDATMGRWHERSSGVNHGAWDVICAEHAYGGWHLGSRTGRIYRLGPAPFDAVSPMRRTIVSRSVYNDGARFVVPRLEILGRFGNYSLDETAPNWLTNEYGFPLVTENGEAILAEDQQPARTLKRPSRMWARFSKDQGHTWTRPKVRDIGKVGQYQARSVFNALGQFRNFTAEINLTDPVDVPLLSEANVEIA